MINCWLDCDPGLDDIFAIILATQNEKLNLLGISSVAGNQTLEKTTRNVLNVLNMSGMLDKVESSALPVVKGADRPLLRDLITAAHVHGDTGLGVQTSRPLPALSETVLAKVERDNDLDADHFTTRIYRIFKQADKPVTLIAVGPLTNVAMLLLNHPDVANYIEKIVVLGGSLGAGNIAPMSEYNMFADPHAASIVFTNAPKLNIKTFLIPLQTTDHSYITDEKMAEIGALGTPFAEMLLDFLLFLKRQVENIKLAPRLHDPMAVAFVIEPEQFEHQLTRVDVETSNPVTLGQTIIDVRNCQKLDDLQKNVYVCLNASFDGFWRLMLDAIKRANVTSVL